MVHPTETIMGLTGEMKMAIACSLLTTEAHSYQDTSLGGPVVRCAPRQRQLLVLLLLLLLLVVVVVMVACLTSRQYASVSQVRIYSDKFTCCHAETEVADQIFYLTQSQFTDTGPTSPRGDPATPGAWQGSHWCANV